MFTGKKKMDKDLKIEKLRLALLKAVEQRNLLADLIIHETPIKHMDKEIEEILDGKINANKCFITIGGKIIGSVDE